MASLSLNVAEYAKSAPLKDSGKSRRALRIAEPIIARLAELYPQKPTARIAVFAGVSVRAVEHWFYGKGDVSADALAALLRSEAGLHVLRAIMGDAKPKWWKRLRRTADLAELRRQQEEQRKLIERLEWEAADE